MQISPSSSDSERDWLGVVLIDNAPELISLLPFFEEFRLQVEFYSESAPGPPFQTAGLSCCLLLRIETGITLLRLSGAHPPQVPVILLADSTDIALAVRAIKLGAADVLERPVDRDQLFASIRSALGSATTTPPSPLAPISLQDPHDVQAAWKSLTARQREFLARIVAGESTRAIAAVLGISQRTADNHRAAIMKKMNASSPSALVQIAIGLGIPSERGDGRVFY